MDKITVKKSELVRELEKNRKNHRKIFEEAQKVYRERVIEELDRMLDDAKNGRKIVRAIGLPEPRDFTKEYDRALKMLKMSTKATMEISSQDFAHFVMDDWPWMKQFSSFTTAYLS